MKVKTQLLKTPEYKFSFEIDDNERRYLIEALNNIHRMLPSGTTPLIVTEFVEALKAVAPSHYHYEFDNSLDKEEN